MTSSPSLITTPPPKNMTCGSLASGAIESSPFARSAKARVSFLNDTLVYALSCGSLRRHRRCRRGEGRAAGDRPVFKKFGTVQSARRTHAQRHPVGRAPRDWQNAAGKGPSLARPRCHSSPSLARSLWRCSSASAPRGCAICSSRRERRRRPSSSSTNWMRYLSLVEEVASVRLWPWSKVVKHKTAIFRLSEPK
jgi:hypothetical protein